MAKKENMQELTGGLTAGLNLGKSKHTDTPPVAEGPKKNTAANTLQDQPVPDVTPAAKPEKTAEGKAEPSVTSSQGLAEIYAGKMKAEAEPRTVRIQAVVTPTTGKRLDELVAQRKIKSKNDLINFLLEGYLETVK